MSIYSQPAFTPLTASQALHPPTRPDSVLTREQTLSFEDSVHSTPHLRACATSPTVSVRRQQQQQQQQIAFLRNVASSPVSRPHSTPMSIPEDTEIGTSAMPLNELMKEITALGEGIYVHRRRCKRLMSCVLWLHKTLLNLDGYEPQWATWIGRLDLFIRHLHRKLCLWDHLGLIHCLAYSETIKSELEDLQSQAGNLGVSKYQSITNDLLTRSSSENTLDERDLSLSLVQIVGNEEFRKGAMVLKGVAADLFMGKLLSSFDNAPTLVNRLLSNEDIPNNYLTNATSLLHAMALNVLFLPSHLTIDGFAELKSSNAAVVGNNFEIYVIEHKAQARALKVLSKLSHSSSSAYASGISKDLFRRITHQTLLLLPTHVHHPHILPLFGLTTQFSTRIPEEVDLPAMVVPWCAGGTLGDYANDVGGVEVNRMRLAAEIAGALAYLHGRGVIHRAVRCENVLINEVGQTQLTGFSHSYALSSSSSTTNPISTPSIVPNGLGSAAEDIDSLDSRTTLSILRSRTVRWTAPWSLIPSPGTGPSGSTSTAARMEKNADKWSFGMLLLELLTGSRPLSYESNTGGVGGLSRKSKSGSKNVLEESVAIDLLNIKYALQFPASWESYDTPLYRTRGFTREVWLVLERCWGSIPLSDLNLNDGEFDNLHGGLSEISLTLERLARDWEYGGREAALKSAREEIDDIARRLDSAHVGVLIGDTGMEGEDDWVHVRRSGSPSISIGAGLGVTSAGFGAVSAMKSPSQVAMRVLGHTIGSPSGHGASGTGTIHGVTSQQTLGAAAGIGMTPRGVPLPMSPSPSNIREFGLGSVGGQSGIGYDFGPTLGIGATGARTGLGGGFVGGTPSKVPLPLSPMMSERPISPVGSRQGGRLGGLTKTPSAFGLQELRSRTGSPTGLHSSTPWQQAQNLGFGRPTSPSAKPWSQTGSPIPLIVPPSPDARAAKSRRAHTTTEVRLTSDDAKLVAGEHHLGKVGLEEEFGVSIEMLHKDEPEGGQWAGRNALWKITGPENHVDNVTKEIMIRIRKRNADRIETVRIDRDTWVLRQEAIKAALDLLSLGYNVTVDISDVQYNMAQGVAVINVTFAGESESTLAASSELTKMIEFHTRYNNAMAVEAPRGLRSRIQSRGRGWLYEIGNSFNVDFELVEEGVVVIRGPASGIEDAKKAFMSHFGDIKRKHETIRSHEVWHKLLRKSQRYVYRSIRSELIRLGISIDSDSGPLGTTVSSINAYIPTRPLPSDEDAFSKTTNTLWQLRPNVEEPSEGISLWRLLGSQDQHAELSSASSLLRGAIEQATHVGFLTLPEEARRSLNRLDEEHVENLCKETGADIRIPKEDELWHCTIVFIGPKTAIEFAKETVLEICIATGGIRNRIA